MKKLTEMNNVEKNYKKEVSIQDLFILTCVSSSSWNEWKKKLFHYKLFLLMSTFMYIHVRWQSILNINFSALHQRFVALSVQRWIVHLILLYKRFSYLHNMWKLMRDLKMERKFWISWKILMSLFVEVHNDNYFLVKSF